MRWAPACACSMRVVALVHAGASRLDPATGPRTARPKCSAARKRHRPFGFAGPVVERKPFLSKTMPGTCGPILWRNQNSLPKNEPLERLQKDDETREGKRTSAVPNVAVRRPALESPCHGRAFRSRRG